MKSTDVIVPYITDNGNPIHIVSKPEQDSYMMGLDDIQKREILIHAAALSNNLKIAATSRSELRKKARNMFSLPANATAEQVSERNKKLEDLKVEYLRLETEINKAKAGNYTYDKDNNLVAPSVRIKLK